MADWFGTDISVNEFIGGGSAGSVDSSADSTTSDWNLSQSQTKGLFGLSYGASAIVSAIGAYGQASSQKQALAYHASIARNNIEIAGWQASAAITAGQNAEEVSDLRTAQTYSSQRAAMAANGVDLAEGSASEVLASTKVIGDINATTIHNNALMTAWGYRVAGVNAANSGNFYGAASKQVNPGTSAATSLLTSAGSVSKAWSSLSTVGAI
jgi:hypothetical protein